MKKKTPQKRLNITKLDNEHVRSQVKSANLKRQKKIRLYRRLAVFAVIVVISFGVLLNIFFNQNKVLQSKQEERESLTAELADKEKEHRQLARQLEKLNDDEYIAKLARQEYFLSDKNEIIFSLPKKQEKSKKKNNEKE